MKKHLRTLYKSSLMYSEGTVMGGRKKMNSGGPKFDEWLQTHPYLEKVLQNI